jgi:DNA-binding PadR family transcriptional regulator
MKYLTRQEIIILLSNFQLGDKAYLVTIREHLKDTTGKNWSVGAIYVPLERLRRLGYLDTRIGEPTAKCGRNNIKYYHLTEKSLKALAEIKRENEAVWTGFSEKAYTFTNIK